MQISFISRTSSSSHGIYKRAFTLVELLISIAIVGVVTSMILVRHSTFDSTVLLKSAAYEAALAIREAQVKSVSVVRSGTGIAAFNYPYGISFSVNPADTKRYVAFRYEHATDYPKYDTGSYTLPIGTTTIDRSMLISDLCIRVSGAGADDCTIDRLDVSFRRPEFKALFYVVGGTDGYGTSQPAAIDYAIIKMSSAINAFNTFSITVTQFGQIAVTRD